MKNDIAQKFFQPVPLKAWKQKVQYLLLGEDFEKKLVRKTSDQIDVLPYYYSDKAQEIISIDQVSPTKTAVYIDEPNESEANKKAIEALKFGVDKVFFSLHHPLVNVDRLVENIHCPVYLQCLFLDVHFLKKVELHQHITILIDPLGKISRTGDWFTNESLDANSAKKLLENKAVECCINLSVFQNAGANIPQQLAYGLSQLAWYMSTCPSINKINYIVSHNTDILLEVAKVKSLKALHESFCAENNIDIAYSLIQQKSSFNLRAFPSSINLSLESIEHLIGFSSGVDTICSMPNHFSFFEEDAHFSKQSIELLTNTSSQKIPSHDGVLAVEKMAIQLSEKSLSIFNEISKGGGYLKQLLKGTIQHKIQENYQTIAANYNELNEIEIEHKLVKTYPFSKFQKNFTLVKPISPKKQSELLEQPIWEKIYNSEK